MDIVILADLGPDPSAGLDSGGLITKGFCGPFHLNSSCYDFEKVDEGRKMTSQLWLRMAGYLNYISFRYVFITSFVSLTLTHHAFETRRGSSHPSVVILNLT